MDFHFDWNQSRDVYDWLVFVCSLALVIIGAWGVKIAVSTLKKIERQTKATEDAATAAKDSAEAARLNAQAIINAERAWLIMAIEQDKESPGLFRLRAKNLGRTPAKIIAASCEFVVVQTTAEMPRLPKYRHTKSFPEGVFLFPEKSQLIDEFSRDHLRTPHVGDDRNGEHDFQMVNEHGYLAIVFGNVLYRDLLGSKEHETRWCSLLKLDTADELFFIDGRDGYTAHT